MANTCLFILYQLVFNRYYIYVIIIQTGYIKFYMLIFNKFYCKFTSVLLLNESEYAFAYLTNKK